LASRSAVSTQRRAASPQSSAESWAHPSGIRGLESVETIPRQLEHDGLLVSARVGGASGARSSSAISPKMAPGSRIANASSPPEIWREMRTRPRAMT
jgi:hypothetical protein